MALIKCPECGKDISDLAASCPQCGYPMPRSTGTASAPARESELDALVRQALLEKGKIAAIKLYRERKKGIGLAEAKVQVERIEAATPPDLRPRSKPAGCLGLLAATIVVVGIVIGLCLRG